MLKRSTRAFLEAGRKQPEYRFIDILHGLFYARWPYLYIGIGIGEHPLARAYRRFIDWIPKRGGNGETPPARGMADTYHGKVLLTEAARSLVLVEQDIELRNLEHVIPYPTARDIVLRNPDHIVALECPCRSARPDPCLPIDVCLIVGEPFASFMLEHHPDRSRSLSRDEAVQTLEEEHQRGHVHHAFFKDAMLGRFYAICNCCSCCCGAMQAMRNGSPMITSSGFLAYVDEDLCIGCETCADDCQFGALDYQAGIAVVDQMACMGCGICIEKCSEAALTLKREASKGTPLEILSLMDEATAEVPI
jgi:ferredoxin